jgi:Zn-dependent protease/CBS domain-containing protein
MKWSIPLGRLFGIGVYLHFTFILFLLFAGYVTWTSTHNLGAAVLGVSFLALLFLCVLLHEFGHALAARRYGIATSDITLLPIGGLARLERMPEQPAQELVIALAGPAVNVVIAALLFLWLRLAGNYAPLAEFALGSGPVLHRLMVVNLFLVAFNLLPAFPMDGGRVLRALLSAWLGRPRATAIAANIGQGLAIVLGLLGFFYNPLLIFIGIFVFLGAQAEASQVEAESSLAGLRVRDAMMTRFRSLAPDDSLDDAVRELLAGSQHDFPVLEDGRPVGMLRRNDLVKALAERRGDTRVVSAMCRECPIVESGAPLLATLASMHERQCPTLPVFEAGQLVGLLTLENVSEVLLVSRAIARRSSVRAAAPFG